MTFKQYVFAQWTFLDVSRDFARNHIEREARRIQRVIFRRNAQNVQLHTPVADSGVESKFTAFSYLQTKIIIIETTGRNVTTWERLASRTNKSGDKLLLNSTANDHWPRARQQRITATSFQIYTRCRVQYALAVSFWTARRKLVKAHKNQRPCACNV